MKKINILNLREINYWIHCNAKKSSFYLGIFIIKSQNLSGKSYLTQEVFATMGIVNVLQVFPGLLEPGNKYILSLLNYIQ